MRKKWLWIVFFLLIGIDQVSKMVAQAEGWVSLNKGVSFGWLGWFSTLQPEVFFWSMFVFIAVAAYSWKHFLPTAVWSWTLFFAGAASNLIDRWVYGGVRDWLPLPFLGVKNNLADCLIAAAVVLVCYHLVREEQPKGNENAA